MSASGLGACPFSLQIHLPAHAHPTQCPQRQTLVDHLKGSLGPLLQAQGAQGNMGKKKGVRSESWCQGLPLVGSQIFLHSSGLLLPMAAPPPPINLNCHCLGSCTVPVVSLGPTCTLQSPFHWTCLKLP